VVTFVGRVPLQLEPTGERLFVKCDEAQKQTAGGVLLPEASAEKATSGTCASGVLRSPTAVP
jgi:co-chaperonin GroES (HSP10)